MMHTTLMSCLHIDINAKQKGMINLVCCTVVPLYRCTVVPLYRCTVYMLDVMYTVHNLHYLVITYKSSWYFKFSVLTIICPPPPIILKVDGNFFKQAESVRLKYRTSFKTADASCTVQDTYRLWTAKKDSAQNTP